MAMANYEEPIFNPITKDLSNVSKSIVSLDKDDQKSSFSNSKNKSQNGNSVPSNRENLFTGENNFSQKR